MDFARNGCGNSERKRCFAPHQGNCILASSCETATKNRYPTHHIPSAALAQRRPKEEHLLEYLWLGGKTCTRTALPSDHSLISLGVTVTYYGSQTFVAHVVRHYQPVRRSNETFLPCFKPEDAESPATNTVGEHPLKVSSYNGYKDGLAGTNIDAFDAIMTYQSCTV